MTHPLLLRIITQLEHDQYRVSDGCDAQDKRDRRNFNAGVLHAILTIKSFEERERIEIGLAELRDAEATTPRERFDVSDQPQRPRHWLAEAPEVAE